MAVTREEELLNSLANGVPSDITPITREEQYLSYIGGGSYSYPSEPITRKEALLKSIAEKGVSGGGGVTIKNQNKTITENGTYTADSGYTGLGTVTVDVQASGGGENKLAQVVDRSVTEITASDLNGITSIRDYAFWGCSNLASVMLPNTINQIGDSAFADCAFASIVIPNSVTSIGSGCFKHNHRLSEITIPKSVNQFGGTVFEQCTNLLSAIIEAEITIISGSTFSKCTSLKTVILPSTITDIYGYSFNGCTALTSVTIKATNPPTLKNTAFANCSALNKIIVPVGCADAYKSATNWSAYADIIVEEGA